MKEEIISKTDIIERSKTENDNLKNEVKTLKIEVEKQKDQIKTVESNLDSKVFEQHGRSNRIRVSGLADRRDVTATESAKMITDLCKEKVKPRNVRW